jgi:glycosyltransferase involved in cell wall biosynthesis
MRVLWHRYPPAEILIVDDGSPERCSDAARSLLVGAAIGAARKRQVQTLAKWWGWGAAELAFFHDEVLLTPNRGVAHARNTG